MEGLTLSLQSKAVGGAAININFGKLPNTILDKYNFAGSQILTNQIVLESFFSNNIIIITVN